MSDPIRVCLLTGRYPPDFGGRGFQIARMLPHLRAAGVEPTVVTSRPARQVEWQEQGTGPVERILPPGGGLGARLGKIVALTRYLRAHAGRFDLFHTSMVDWHVYANLRWLRRQGVPVILEMTLLGADDPVSIAERRFGGLQRSLLRDGVDAWFGISNAFRASVLASGVPEERFHVLHHGIDTDVQRLPGADERRALRERLGLPVDARIASSIGALQHRKGMERVLRAWAASRPQAGRDLLLLAGPARVEEGLRPEPTHPDYAEQVRRRADEPDVAGTVRIVGRVDEPQAWLGASDLFVFLSRREGFGLVILEAMACGLPCVLSPLDGISRELVGAAEGHAAWVMDDPDDEAAVGARIAELLPEAPGRDALRQRARAHVVDHFSMQVRTERQVALYRELLARP